MADTITLKTPKMARLVVTIQGTSPLIPHNWNEGSRQALRDKDQGKQTAERDDRPPEDKAHDCFYFTADKKYGVLAGAIMKAMITAAHKDIGIEKTLVRKSIRVICNDPGNVIEIKCSDPIIREEIVTYKGTSKAVRYRPQFNEWEATFEVEYNATTIAAKDVLNLVNLAGFGVGIHEWRPEQGKAGQGRRGVAWHGKAWHGTARLGEARGGSPPELPPPDRDDPLPGQAYFAVSSDFNALLISGVQPDAMSLNS